MKLCPFCQQDAVWLVRLKSSPEHQFKMCFECDSVWTDNQVVSDQAGTTFDKYMQAMGRTPNWKDIEKITTIR
jgi:Zn-finger nucleic acid-binding protein